MTEAITDLLDRAAQTWPEKDAFVDGTRKLTFDGLRRKALGIASALRSLRDDRAPAAIYMERDCNAVSAMLGAAYSRRAYVPLDMASPPARQQPILASLSPSVLLTEAKLESRVRKFWDGDLLLIEDISEQAGKLEESSSRPMGDDPLCILFTSGSTGKPKGVVIPHRAVLANMEQYVEEMGLEERDILGSVAPFHYVLSFYDVYGGLRAGCTVHLLAGAAMTFPAMAMSYLLEHRITSIFWAPTALKFVADTGILEELAEKSALPPLRRVCFAGGVMPVPVLNRWRKAFPAAEYTNLYGFTETAGVAAFYRVRRDFEDREALPLGRGGQGRETFLLHEDGSPVLGTEEGEVWVRGSCLALGYYDDLPRTMAAFTQDPRHPKMPSRVFRTGDIARYGEDGNLYYVSRRDFQVKHLGRRVELGEIETAAQAAGLGSVCCLHDSARDELVLFYEGTHEETALLAALRQRLPSYMVPTRLMPGPIPLTSRGKIDRQALREKLL